MKGFGFALLLLLVLGVAAFVLWPGAPTYAKHGPYLVGAREFVIKTSLASRSLPATLWYPALNPKDGKKVSTVTMNNAAFGGTNRTISGNALQDAAPDPSGGPFPLVVFSHGSPGTRADAVPRMEHWASHGFAVLAVDHGKYERYRTADLRDALDFAEQLTTLPGPFAKFIDTQHTAAAGFSLGGLSVLYMGGAHYTGLSDEPRDPRLKALVLLAPVNDFVKTNDLDLSAATLPTLVAVGSKDDLFTEAEQVYQGLPAPRKSLVTLIGGTHVIFMDASLKKTFPGLGWGTLDVNRAQDLIHHVTTAFLLDVLKNDPKARKALLPEAVKFEEVQYATNWK
jgi:predicted dienelactone hydrolase